LQDSESRVRETINLMFKNSKFLLLPLALILLSNYSRGQELEPRAFWIGPVSTNAAIFSYAHSRGGFAADPSLPVEGVASNLNSLQFGYYRTLDFLGRSANITLTLPYPWGPTQGKVNGDVVNAHSSGLGDPRFRFSVNLMGAPAMTIPEFQAFRRSPGTILGFAFRIQPPLGQYDSHRLINLGSNRWSFNPKLGLIYPINPSWVIELNAGAWLFTENKDFLGSTKKQDPLLHGEFHLIYRIRPGFWVGFDTTYYWGGRTTVGGEIRYDLQRNLNAGGTIAINVWGGHGFKFTANTGLSIDFGGDRTSFAVAYQYTWIGD